jgi:homospermidine synthase
LLTAGGGQGFCVNVSVDTSSLDIMELCREIGALYIDTVVEPWKGFYFDSKLGPEARSNYALRESILAARRKRPGGPTAVSCCGANPGMVSWFVKQALLNIAGDVGLKSKVPKTREEWARLARKVGIKGIHIAERDTQRAKQPKPMNVFVNTWSVEGFISEGLQPAELGWGTHEKWAPSNVGRHKGGCGAAIYMLQPGANTRVRSWTPTAQAQLGFLVTHNESISIADYFTIKRGRKTIYRPTCHYAYHPCNDAVLSLHEVFGRAGAPPDDVHILDEHEIADGIDELGVLLYGHKKNAYWYGSQLSIDETREVAPYQNATGLQVTSAVLAGMVWALENPRPASSRPMKWISAAASKCSSLISAQSSALTPTGRPSPAVRDFSRKTSTSAMPGSSETCCCTEQHTGTPNMTSGRRGRPFFCAPVISGFPGGFSPGFGGGRFCCCGGGAAGRC